jgi:hypothetical protein
MGMLVRVQYRPQKSLGVPIKRFLASLPLSKGESWINWGSKLVTLIENQRILLRVPDLPEIKQKLRSNPTWGTSYQEPFHG